MGKGTDERKKMATRVVVISDTHNRHDEVSLPGGDILIHCGDATGRGRPGEVEKFLAWFDKQPYVYKIMIAGNHDFMFQTNPLDIGKGLLNYPNTIYLQDSSIICFGIKFYGSPWQPWFHDWAFNAVRGEEIAAIWDNIPPDTDFLITHGPPMGILDRTQEGDRVGCEDLWRRIKKIKPRVHAFGHIHEAYGTYYNEHTLFANASICTLNYVPSNKPIVFDRDADGNFVFCRVGVDGFVED